MSIGKKCELFRDCGRTQPRLEFSEVFGHEIFNINLNKFRSFESINPWLHRVYKNLKFDKIFQVIMI